MEHPARLCPSCKRPTASEHRQLRARLFVCPALERGWKFATDARNKLVVMAIAPDCDVKRATDLLAKAEIEGQVSDGPGTHIANFNTPLLRDASLGLSRIVPARSMPKTPPPSKRGRRHRAN